MRASSAAEEPGRSCLHFENTMSEHEDRLNDLCDRGELEDLLALVSLDTVATTWCRYTERSLAARSEGRSYEHPDWWAVNFF
jgi:hypothetical protein